MYSWERRTVLRDDRYRHEKQNPSFSSTLLDKIYRSIDDGGETKGENLRFCRETMEKKQSRAGAKSNSRAVEEEEMLSLRQACLLEKWMERKVSEKLSVHHQRQLWAELDSAHKSKLDHDYDHHDALFFSSASNSSDSSSGGLSSSDTESMYGGVKSSNSCFAPPRPKPIRTTVSSTRSEKNEKKTDKQSTMFYEQRKVHMFGDYHYNSATEQTPKLVNDGNFIKSKSRASNIYGNLKKVKQPISPGGRLASFLNSIFTNSKKSKHTPSMGGQSEDFSTRTVRNSKSVQGSTCSSASSFSRSCLSKHSPASREKLRNGVKRSVRFCPVSVIVDEDLRPCGHKSLYQEDEEEEETRLMSVSVPAAWKIGRSPSTRNDVAEVKFRAMEKSRRVEEAAREFLREYHQTQNKNKIINNDLIMRSVRDENYGEDEDEEDNDAASCSSSDLFELDHLAVIGGGNRYREELPVYETTRVDRNRLMM